MFCNPRTDCFAYDPKRCECNALNDLYCAKEVHCAFYKTEAEAVNTSETVGYYKYRLQNYFDTHFSQFAGEAEFFPDPAHNTWEFFIPSTGEIIKLKCSPVGRVSVLRKKVGRNGN